MSNEVKESKSPSVIFQYYLSFTVFIPETSWCYTWQAINILQTFENDNTQKKTYDFPSNHKNFYRFYQDQLQWPYLKSNGLIWFKLL